MKTSRKAAPSAKAQTSSTKIPKESFEDDQERQLIADTYEARYYAYYNPPTREEILEQVRQSGFVPTLGGKPIESEAKPAKKRSKKSALLRDDSIGAVKRAALRSFAASQSQRPATLEEAKAQAKRLRGGYRGLKD